MRIPDFKLERYFDRYEFSVPYLLSSSDAEPLRLDELLGLADDEMRSVWDGLVLGYTDGAGHRLLREAIAALYEHVTADDVLVFSGAQEPIFALANVCLEPGDHAVVVTPAYQSLFEVARAAGADVDLVPLDESAGWALDLELVRARLRPATRLIVVNVPNNPTGSVLPRSDFEALFDLAAETGARVLSDEVYRFLELDPADRLPAAADLSPRAVSIGVVSKSLGLAGLRIGWVATRDAALRDRLRAFKHYLTICNAGPSEILATIALRAHEPILARTRDIVAHNLRFLDDFFAGPSGEDFRWVRPRAGTVGFPELLAPIEIDHFAEELATELGVMLLPGSVFDYPGNHFRVGFGRANMPAALGRLERFATRRLAPARP